MARRGPKSKHPSGNGTITDKGYHRVWCATDSRKRFMHNIIWEKANGPIPHGHDIHHINHKRSDNRLCNLQIVSKTEHKRLHSGCELHDGIWWKPCKLCEELKPIDTDHWYISPEGRPLYGRCRPCHIRRVVVEKQLRKQRDS